MIEHLRQAPADTLGLEEYSADFWRFWQKITDRFDKLERAQHFQERDNPSWEAFAAGDWDQALELMQAEDEHSGYARENAPPDVRKVNRRRLRVVELPVTPYLQWEFHWYRRTASDEQIRIIDPAALAGHETTEPVPELVILGSNAMYEVLYDQDLFLCGARRILDPALINGCRTDFDQLWEQGEDLTPFFAREIAHLPPPAVTGR